MAKGFSRPEDVQNQIVIDPNNERITDNSGTKIVLRINDPDSAEYFARTFGTNLIQKITQKITNVKEIDRAEVAGDGTQ